MAATSVEWEAVNALLFDNWTQELIHFHSCSQTDLTSATPFTMPDGNINRAEEVQRLLCRWFERKINIQNHFRIKAASALRAFRAIFRCASTEKRLNDKPVRQLFQAYVSTISDFGAEVR